MFSLHTVITADSIFPSHIFTEFAASANSYAELLLIHHTKGFRIFTLLRIWIILRYNKYEKYIYNIESI